MLLDMFVSNLSPSLTEEQLAEIFAEKGEVVEARILINLRTGELRDAARVKLETDIPFDEILEHFNHITVDGYSFYTTPFTPPKDMGKASPEEKAVADKIADALNENERHPRIQIIRLVQFCGPHAIQKLYEETMAIEEEGGLLINDGSRRRTPGGVFFYVARRRFSYKVQRLIFFNPQRKKTAKGDEKEGQKPGKGAPPKKQPKGDAQPKKQPKGDAQPKKQPKGNVPAKPKSNLPPINEEELAAAREQLNSLQKAHQKATAQLEHLKAAPPNERKSGLFSATREVANLQRQINELLNKYPHLEA